MIEPGSCCDDPENQRLDPTTGSLDCVSCGASLDAVAQLLQALGEVEPEAILYEPRAIFDRAIVGLTCQPCDRWPRDSSSPWVVEYDAELVVEAMVEAEDPKTPEAWDDAHTRAVEWVEFNSMGGWLGEHTPTWVQDRREPDDELGNEVEQLRLCLKQARAHVVRQQHHGRHEQDRADAVEWVARWGASSLPRHGRARSR